MPEINIKNFILSCGILGGFILFVLALVGKFLGWGSGVIAFLSYGYAGYAPTLGGSLAGLVWGLIDGAVLGAVLAWVYNRLTKN